MTTAAYAHTCARLWQRYNRLSLTFSAYQQVCATIRDGLPDLPHRRALDSTRLIVPLLFEGQLVNWVYCPYDRIVATVLPARESRSKPRERQRLKGGSKKKHPARPYRRDKHWNPQED